MTVKSCESIVSTCGRVLVNVYTDIVSIWVRRETGDYEIVSEIELS
jgi:hypothetical protein